MTGDEWAWALAAGVCVGALLGALLTLLWRVRSEHASRVELAVLRSRIKADETVSLEREQALAQAREQLHGVFGEALQERQTAIETLVQPIRDALAKTETQIHSIERERIDAFATLKTQMEILASGQLLLSRETRNLVTALRRPDVRGQWGEMTLRRLVELSGMAAHVDFTEQLQQRTDLGFVRPDMVVHMPLQRDIVVDVKTPLDAYLSAVEAQDDGLRASHLARHSENVAARIRELASKNYWSQFERSPDFVVLFLPGEQFLSAALQENPGLIDDALRQNVMLATPLSLVALLKAVAYGWKQGTLADNAAEIRRLGEDIYKRLAVFGEHLGRLGKSLGSSVDSFNKAVGSLEHQVLPAARRFPDLGLRIHRELHPIEPVTSLTRVPRDSDEASSETT